MTIQSHPYILIKNKANNPIRQKKISQKDVKYPNYVQELISYC